MNIIEGQAKQKRSSSLFFYSLTFDNILNIVVLLILAGVSLNLVLGNNGIVSKATDAGKNYEVASEEESKKLNSQVE